MRLSLSGDMLMHDIDVIWRAQSRVSAVADSSMRAIPVSLGNSGRA